MIPTHRFKRACAAALAAAVATTLAPALATSLLLAVVPASALLAQTPIVFVHGNGDHAGLWDTTIWRFESNGYPSNLLFAVDLPSPSASARYTVPELNRSTPEDQTAALAAYVTRVLLKSGADKVVLVGSSRGGMTIRNYLRFGGGRAHVSHAVLSGTPNHGVFALAALQPESEFNGAGAYLKKLNDSVEVVDGVEFLTIRSDNNDKFAQSDGAALGMAGVATNVDATGPALRGAEDVVLPNADHREVAFAPNAFAAMYRFLTGAAPQQTDILPDSVAVLSGLISGTVNGAATNTALPGAALQIFRVNASTGARIGEAVHSQVVNFSGQWGPFRANPAHHYEFALATPDSSSLTHVFRSPFPRSSDYVNFRLAPPSAARGDSSAVLLLRPRGYLGAGRDTVLVNGERARGIPPGVATIDRVLTWWSSASPASVTLRFNNEIITAQTRGGDVRRTVIAEFSQE